MISETAAILIFMGIAFVFALFMLISINMSNSRREERAREFKKEANKKREYWFNKQSRSIIKRELSHRYRRLHSYEWKYGNWEVTKEDYERVDLLDAGYLRVGKKDIQQYLLPFDDFKGTKVARRKK